MRLYLSSFDLGDRPETLAALAGSARRAAIVVNALDNRPRARSDWLRHGTESLLKLGFDVSHIDLRDYFGASAALGAVLDDIDVVWVNGGNTFILRRAMKQSGFDSLIKSALAQDRILYGGFSAGAAIATASLRGLEIIDDPNDVPQDYEPQIVWDGLGLVPFAVALHFKSDHPDSDLVDRTIALYQKKGMPYRAIRDGEALIVHGGREQIVG